MTNQTTTTRPAAAVLMLPAVTATRAARIEAARQRHPINNRPATWAAKPAAAPYCPAHLMTAGQLEQTARAAAFTALQRREMTSGLHLMRQLLQSDRANEAAKSMPDLAAQSIDHDRRHNWHKAKAASYQRIADRKDTDPKTAKAARAKAKEHRRAAAAHLAERDSIDRRISAATHTDIADIQSAAKAAIWAMIADPAADIDSAYPAAVKAASAAIDNSAQATTLTSTRTAWGEALTLEAARAWQAAHPAANKVYFNVRDSARAGYITLEHWTPKADSKRQSKRPAGWYLVKHYNTVPPCMSYEVFTESAAGQAAIVKNDGVNAILTQQDSEDIAALLMRANLSPKEQEICYKVVDQTAAKHSAAALHEYMESARAKAATQTPATARKTMSRARAAAPAIEAAAALESALDRSKVYADRTRRRYVANIRKALEAAQTPAAIQTAEEREERERKAWEQMQRSARRAAPARATERPDLIGAVARAAQEAATAPAVAWLTNYPAPQTLTAQEAAEAAQRAAAVADGYILDQAKAHKSRTPWHNAGQAAAVFMAYTMTAEEVTAASRAARAAESAERDRADRAARIADSARKERERAARAKQDPAAAVLAWLTRIGAADLADLLTK